ncbi:hypothetical protein PLICRDRAFT_175594 [Plicaturopsis crispa FD-325 SS-3]|nr:hypothetical protein PLICRDRAFT_175594 [Plicaturopsis crispa FD-325 SS-3]
MRTVRGCHTRKLTFAPIHGSESYCQRNRASTINSMLEVIRNTFIALHFCDVLVELRER